MEARKVIKNEAKKLMKQNLKNVFWVCAFLGVFAALVSIVTSCISQYVIWAGVNREELVQSISEGSQEALALYTSLTNKETQLNFLSLIASFITMFFTLSQAGFFLKQVDEKQPTVKMFFQEKRYLESFKLSLLIAVKTFLWTLLFIIPGIIKAFSYSMAPYLKYKNPEKSCDECIKKSCELMKGYKGSLFVLYLSFIGWYILAGIGAAVIQYVPVIGTYLGVVAEFIFTALISGYVSSSQAIFYNELTSPYLFDKYHPSSAQASAQPPKDEPFEELKETKKEDASDPFDFEKENINSQSKNDGEKSGEEL